MDKEFQVMDALEHKRIREGLDMSQRELGGLLGCGQTAIAQRDQGLRPVPETTAMLMRYMERYGPPEVALAAAEDSSG